MSTGREGRFDGYRIIRVQSLIFAFLTTVAFGAVVLGIAAAVVSGRVTAAPALSLDSAAQLQTLRDEIDNDPQSLGYSGKTNFQIAQILNTVGLSGETVDVPFVTTGEIQGAVVGSEYLLLTAPQRDLWDAVLSAANTSRGVPIDNTNIRGQILDTWDPGTATRSNLAALQTRSASRAEVLFGAGTIITDNDVEEALLLP